MIAAQAGRHFDPEVVAAFLTCTADIEAIQRECRDAGPGRIAEQPG